MELAALFVLVPEFSFVYLAMAVALISCASNMEVPNRKI